MSQVAILLTTYNSTPFLSALIESLIGQTFENWDLYAMDDGSIDSTKNILIKYSRLYSKIHIVDNPRIHSGPKENFMYLLSIIKSDYYMFCDHDDIWLPDKIRISMQRMNLIEQENKNTPIVVHSDLRVVDTQLRLIDDSFFRYSGICPRILLSSINHLAHSNCVTGCTMLFNHMVKELVFPVHKYALMHDSWIALKVFANHGIISCIEEPLILYRQHSNNTLGAIQNHVSLNILKSIRENRKQYLMAHNITNIGVWKFILYRLIYLWEVL